jgi:hypothetical protein
VTGARGAGLGGFDSTMKSFMQARNIACGQLAVARKGKLVLARGYTWTSSSTLKTQPTSLFRIASLSKPVTAVDMVRFAAIFDSANSVLNSTSIARAFAKPETGVQSDGSWYGCGWSVRNVTGGRNTWHTGSLPGTHTILVRRYDGLTWAALFDQRDDASGKSYGDIDLALHQAANAVTTWPSSNLYGSYF